MCFFPKNEFLLVLKIEIFKAEHPTDSRDIEQAGDQPRCRASSRSQRYRVDWRLTKMQSILQIQRYGVDCRSTEMQCRLPITGIWSRLEINQDAEHPTDHIDIEQTGDQQRCRASSRSRDIEQTGDQRRCRAPYRPQRYGVDCRSTEIQCRLPITGI